MRLMSFFLFVSVKLIFSLSLFAQGSEDVRLIQAKVQLARIEMRTIDKSIRRYQDDLLSVQNRIEKNKEQVRLLQQQNPKAFESNQELDREIILAELSLIDDDSLESHLEEEVLLGSLKYNFNKNNQKNTLANNIARKLHQAQSQLDELYKIQNQNQRSLSRSKRKKALLSASIEEYKNQITSYEDFSLVEKAIEKAQKISGEVRDSLGGRLDTPVQEYASYQKEENGLRFKCFADCILRAPATGYVIHIGELIPYGQILILSHANKMRSVFLGEFNANFQKGTKLFRGDRIGKTYNESMGSFYFELRRDNKPTNILDQIPTI